MPLASDVRRAAQARVNEYAAALRAERRAENPDPCALLIELDAAQAVIDDDDNAASQLDQMNGHDRAHAELRLAEAKLAVALAAYVGDA